MTDKPYSLLQTSEDLIGDPMFLVDERLAVGGIKLWDWPLSRLFLKNNRDYPWFIMVPRRANLTELTQLCQADRLQLMEEIHALSVIMTDVFRPDKLNMGALGNMVPQFHYHIVGRFKTDPLWPEGIWQRAMTDHPYIVPDELQQTLLSRIKQVAFVR